MEYLKVDKAFAQQHNHKRSEDGSFQIEFTELKDGSFIIESEVKELLETVFVKTDEKNTDEKVVEIEIKKDAEKVEFTRDSFIKEKLIKTDLIKTDTEIKKK